MVKRTVNLLLLIIAVASLALATCPTSDKVARKVWKSAGPIESLVQTPTERSKGPAVWGVIKELVVAELGGTDTIGSTCLMLAGLGVFYIIALLLALLSLIRVLLRYIVSGDSSNDPNNVFWRGSNRKSLARFEEELKTFGERLDVQMDKLQKGTRRVTEIECSIKGIPSLEEVRREVDSLGEHLGGKLRVDLEKTESLRSELREIVRTTIETTVAAVEAKVMTQALEEVRRLAAGPRSPEVENLPAAWAKFRRRAELKCLADEFENVEAEELRLRDCLEQELARLLEAPELKRSYEIALGPLESYLFVLRKLKNILALAEPSDGQAEPSEPQVVLRAREGLQLLTLLQASDLTTRLRQFSFRNWLKEEFRRFAEVFFQTWARQGEGSEAMEQARQIVVEALGFVGFKPMEITLGRTRFDSGRHVGRGTNRQLDKEDGVIIGIVRFGFEDMQGNVLQPAEVIVNRRS